MGGGGAAARVAEPAVGRAQVQPRQPLRADSLREAARARAPRGGGVRRRAGAAAANDERRQEGSRRRALADARVVSVSAAHVPARGSGRYRTEAVQLDAADGARAAADRGGLRKVPEAAALESARGLPGGRRAARAAGLPQHRQEPLELPGREAAERRDEHGAAPARLRGAIPRRRVGARVRDQDVRAGGGAGVLVPRRAGVPRRPLPLLCDVRRGRRVPRHRHRDARADPQGGQPVRRRHARLRHPGDGRPPVREANEDPRERPRPPALWVHGARDHRERAPPLQPAAAAAAHGHRADAAARLLRQQLGAAPQRLADVSRLDPRPVPVLGPRRRRWPPRIRAAERDGLPVDRRGAHGHRRRAVDGEGHAPERAGAGRSDAVR